MNILGVHDGHNAGACILKDGKVASAISTERITRIKNDTGYPKEAIAEALRIAGLKAGEIEKVAVASTQRSTTEWFMNTGSWYQSRLPAIAAKAEFTLPPLRRLYPAINFTTRNIIKRAKLNNQQLVRQLKKDFGLENAKFAFIDHHLCHAAYSYYGRNWEGETLILTLDGRGDGICATASIGNGNEIKRISETKGGNSVAELYLGATAYLGMKPLEHEYKVMGLAPYASPQHGEKAAAKLKGVITFDEKLTFRSKIRTNTAYYWIKEKLANERFDNVAYGIQKFTEELVTEWARKAVQKTGLTKIALGGGLFMNVKLNKLILELPEAEKLFISPSCSDESLMIGAAMAEQAKTERPEPLKDIYYGAEYSEEHTTRMVAEKGIAKKYEVERHKDINGKVAELISNNEVVARCTGRMEFGARALGNRSIITNPSSFSNVRIINQMIKSRDFWMPFAPSILSEAQQKYMINPKKMEAPYMITAFDSVPENREQITAAMHQYDFTIRPQTVEKAHNNNYHSIISQFRKKTGIGAVLNTSFNLHGYPVIYTPEDAYYVFENSGLKYLQIGNHLISKKS